MSGIFGSADLDAGRWTTVATCDRDDPGGAVTVVNVVNRSNVTIEISVAVSDTIDKVNNNSYYVEYHTELPPKGTLERSGLVINKGQFINVKSNLSGASVVVWGTRHGDITAPEIFTSGEVNLITAGGTTETRLGVDSTELGAVSYSIVSGTLPTGITLQSDGRLTGTMPTTGYTAAGVTTTVTFAATSGSYTTNKTLVLRKLWADGSTAERAAPSAQFIKTIKPSAGDEFYWIQLPGDEEPAKIWCDMTNSGGGWMMLWLQQGGPQQQQNTSFYTVLNNLEPHQLSPYRWRANWDFGRTELVESVRNRVGLDFMKQYNVYDSGGNVQNYTMTDTNTNGITHTMSSTSRQVFDILETGANVSFNDIWSTGSGTQGVGTRLQNTVTLYVDDGVIGGSYNYGTADEILVFSNIGRGFSNSGNGTTDQVSTTGNHMQGWGARHWISYSINSSGTDILRCQYECWSGQAVRLEIAVLAKENGTTYTRDVIHS